MSKPITTVWHAANELAFVKGLRAYLERVADGDEDVVRDTIEGSDKVDPLMEALLDLRNDALAMAQARKALAKTYTEAARADQARADKIEDMILEGLKTAGVPSWKGVAGSASIRAGSWSTDVYRPGSIPYEYTKNEPNVARIKEELEGLRKELEAMSDGSLLTAAKAEGVDRGVLEAAKCPLSAGARRNIIAMCFSQRIPGARLVLGEDTLSIRLPTGKKE